MTSKVKVFISYQRRTSSSQAWLIFLKLKEYGFDPFLDVRGIDGTAPFGPQIIAKEIQACDIFVCLLGDQTLSSDWVRREIEYAYQYRKPMIPVFQEKVRLWSKPQKPIAALLDSLGLELPREQEYFDKAISRLAEMIRQNAVEPFMAADVSVAETEWSFGEIMPIGFIDVIRKVATTFVTIVQVTYERPLTIGMFGVFAFAIWIARGIIVPSVTTFLLMALAISSIVLIGFLDARLQNAENIKRQDEALAALQAKFPTVFEELDDDLSSLLEGGQQ